jgi:peptidoglycan/LPS O-acetylase OafA/YrhL
LLILYRRCAHVARCRRHAHPAWLHPRYLVLLTPLRIDALAAGSLLAIVHRQHGDANFFVRQRVRIWLVCGLALAITIFRKKGLWQGDPFTATLGISIVACFGASTLVLALFAPRNGLMHKIWSHPALGFMGRYSYGIYVYHSFVQAFVGWYLPALVLGRWLHQLELGDMAFVVICTLGSILVAVCSYHLYEMPFLQLKRHFQFPSSSQPQAPAVAPAI